MCSIWDTFNLNYYTNFTIPRWNYIIIIIWIPRKFNKPTIHNLVSLISFLKLFPRSRCNPFLLQENYYPPSISPFYLKSLFQDKNHLQFSVWEFLPHLIYYFPNIISICKTHSPQRPNQMAMKVCNFRETQQDLVPSYVAAEVPEVPAAKFLLYISSLHTCKMLHPDVGHNCQPG